MSVIPTTLGFANEYYREPSPPLRAAPIPAQSRGTPARPALPTGDKACYAARTDEFG